MCKWVDARNETRAHWRLIARKALDAAGALSGVAPEPSEAAPTPRTISKEEWNELRGTGGLIQRIERSARESVDPIINSQLHNAARWLKELSSAWRMMEADDGATVALEAARGAVQAGERPQ